MLPPSASSGPLTHTRRNWLVLSFFTFPCTLGLSLSQGELAHRLVKRFYGLTNKKDAPEQIARRCRRAHHFSASESCDPSPSSGGGNASRRDAADDMPELHHTVTNSRNNPVELASFSKTQDPAAKVGLHTLRCISILTHPPEFRLQTPHPPSQPAPRERPQRR